MWSKFDPSFGSLNSVIWSYSDSQSINWGYNTEACLVRGFRAAASPLTLHLSHTNNKRNKANILSRKVIICCHANFLRLFLSFRRVRFCLFLCAFAASSQTLTLPYRPVTAEYSNALDRIIFIAASPSQLHIFDPLSNTDIPVNLPKPPLSLSVSLDGLHAAVGHDALISWVNLQTATVEKILPANITVTSLVLGKYYVYILTYSGGTEWIQISTGTSGANGVYNGTTGRLHPSGMAIYTTEDGSSPEHLQDLNVSTGPVTNAAQGPYHGDYGVCGGVWFSPDGRRTYTGCGTVYQAAPEDTGLGLLCCGSGTLDTKADDLYWTTLTGAPLIRSLTESEALGRVAAIPSSYQYSQNPVNDNQVLLYDSPYLEPAGIFQLPDFTANGKTYQAHGQQVFYNQSSTALYAVMQADGSSGLLNDFAVQIFRLDSSQACTATLDVATATLPASGTVATVGIAAPASCIYQAFSDSSWIHLISGAYGSGNGTLTYIVRPNSGAQRTGHMTIGGQSFAVTQPAASTPPNALTPLGYSVVGADYTKAIDRVVLIVSNPNELHIYDPVGGSDRIVPLPKPPFSVSVGPDGLSAAVGFDGWVSIVNLSTATITSTVQVFTDVHTILLAGHGYLYAYPQRTWASLFSVQAATGAIDYVSAIYNGRYPVLYADGNSFYTEGSKWDISQGPAKLINENLSGGCAPFWLTEDGARMITSCGKAYTTSPVPSLDLQYSGSFSNAVSIQWAAESAKWRSTAVIPSAGSAGSSNNGDTYLQIYGDAYFGYAGDLSLPVFMVGSTPYVGRGRYVFWNSTEDKLIILEQADSSAILAADYGATVYPLTTPAAGCSYALGARSASFDKNGGLNTVSVTTGAGCIWDAVSNVSWISVNSGAVAFGSNTAAYTVAPNTGVGRSGTLTVAGQKLTVTQAGATGPARHLSVTAPATATAGVPIQFTVKALDANNNLVTTFSDTVHFTSTDSAAKLPIDKILNGVGTFSASLVTFGTQTITASDLLNSSIAGTSGNIAVSLPSGLRYVPVTPCRVVDTRNPAGPLGGPAITAGSSRDFVIPGSCGIPSTAQAYSLNASVVPAGKLGYMTLWPTGQGQPLTATLNSLDGRIKGSAAIVPAGTDGAISVFVTDQTHVILDINGYFTPSSQQTGGQVFYPVTPCRIGDTRKAAGPLGGPSLAGKETRAFPILSSPCGIPSSAQAFSLNLAVVPPGPLGYLTAWSTGQPQPLVSTLNDLTGTIVANAAIVPAGTAGSIDVYATNTTDLVVDINGYFAPAGMGGLSFYPLPPCRVLDTRIPSGSPAFSGSIDVDVIESGCGGTGAAQAYVLNATVVPSGPMGYLTLWPQGAVRPLVSTLNAVDGAITSNMAIVPTSNTKISGFASNNTYLILDVAGYFAP